MLDAIFMGASKILLEALRWTIQPGILEIISPPSILDDIPLFGGSNPCLMVKFYYTFYQPPWICIPGIVSGLVHPTYIWTKPACSKYNWRYIPPTNLNYN